MAEFLFGKITADRGPLRIGLPPEEVFAGDDVAQARFIPLVSFDLALVRRDWRGTAHFVYLELADHSSSTFGLRDGDGLEYRGDYREYNLDALSDEPIEWKARHATVVSVDVPLIDEPWTPSSTAIAFCQCKGVHPRFRRECEYWESVREIARAADPVLSHEFVLGGAPNWFQDDETPVDDEGRRLPFVGQVKADLFAGIADLSLYLFFDDRRRMLVQIAQPD